MHTSCYTARLDFRNHCAGWLYSYPATRETAEFLNYETLCPTLAKSETLSVSVNCPTVGTGALISPATRTARPKSVDDFIGRGELSAAKDSAAKAKTIGSAECASRIWFSIHLNCRGPD
jgi:hypothetical protein